MPEYNTEKAKITDAVMQDWKKEKKDTIALKTGFFTFYDETVRENVARAFMMACGRTLKDTFDPGKTNERIIFGKQFAAVLEKAAGFIRLDLNADLLNAGRVTGISNDFFRKNPDARENVGKRAEFPDTNDDVYDEKDIRKWRREEQRWAQRLLEEMYYTAMKNVMETPYPDIDYSNAEEIRAFADSYQVVLDMGKAFAGNKTTEVTVYEQKYENITVQIAKRHQDSNALMEQLQKNNMIRSAVLDACVDPGKPFRKEKLEQALNGKMVLELYGKDLAGMSGSEAAEKHSLEELEGIRDLAQKLAKEEYKSEQYQQIKDYLDGKPEGISPFYLKDGNVVRNAAFDRRTPTFDFSKLPDTLSNAAKFDQVFSKFEDHPSIQEDSPVKRIYIDGKNAYDMLKDKYQGTESMVEEQVKEEIVQVLMDAKKRVEFARIDVTNGGQPKVTVVPVTADLSRFDEGKKWYESSVAKKANNLWKNDSKQEKRRAEISKEVEERQRTKMALAGYDNSFYNNIFTKINDIRRGYINPEFLAAEKKMKDNPKSFLGEDKDAYDSYVQVHICNVKVMETMVADMQNISAANPEKFRSDIRSIRSLMETVGISQDDMNKYGESLEGAQKESFEQIRRWEKTVLNGNWGTVIPSAEGSANVKASVDRMLKMYQNAYYEKLGYEERIDHAFAGHAADHIFNSYKDKPVKKQVDFGKLLKDSKMGQKAPESRTKQNKENTKNTNEVKAESGSMKK